MKKTVLVLCSGLLIAACSNNSSEKESKQAEENVQSVMKSDEEKMDSMRKAIDAQMNKVSDDSLLNEKYGN